MFVKMKQAALAAAVVFGLGMGVASAYDYCNVCPKPVVVTPVCDPCVRAKPAPVVAYCDPCGAPAVAYAPAPSASQVMGYQVERYSYSTPMYSSSMSSGGIDYWIPTMNGMMESNAPTLPPNNPVDMYYSTHMLTNDSVVEVPAPAISVFPVQGAN